MSGFNQKLEALFEATLALDTEVERAQYLAHACPDPEMRREVESLVASHCDPDPIFAQKTKVIRFVESHNWSGDQFAGQTLDEKYRLDRLLGQGGMGAVYLSTHLGTGRYVAVKLIAPEFMSRQEFLQRFKREAQAAGRLRHPNIVDVTDFGITRVAEEELAYLVMEYLDGCTLADVLAEEKRLPLHWVVDIMEQVCSAVQEAHQRGIVHRDLKPANIWLEPNTLGGCRVKVLDFGIAKLAEASDSLPESVGHSSRVVCEHSSSPSETETGAGPDASSPGIPKTLPPSPGPRLETAGAPQISMSSPGEGLTRVGAILGTPAYMSPEQCRGQALDARSDIYSLGIIAYQMLSGTLPFTGEPAFLIRAQQMSEPTTLSEHCKTVPKTVSRLIMSALEKDPGVRPQTANAFAQALRANAEELGALYRRAFALYSEYFPQVLKISLLAHIPVLVVSAISVIMAVNESRFGQWNSIFLRIALGLLKGTAGFVTGSFIAGLMAIIVVGLAVAPLKAVTLRSTVAILRRRLRPLLKTGLMVTVRIVLGLLMLGVPGLVMSVRYCLWAPVVLLEGLANKTALRRSRDLVARSWSTGILAMAFQFLVTVLAQWMITRLISKSPAWNNSVQGRVIAEFAGLSSIFVTPLVSIVLTLVYLKMRQLGGELPGQLMPQIETSSSSRWEQRMRTRVFERTPNS